MMPKRLQRLFADEYVVDPASWHGRLYANWMSHAEFKTPAAGFQESFCHYWRVVAVWAPLDWLLFTKLWRIPVLLYLWVATIAALVVLSPGWVFMAVILTLAAALAPMSFMPTSVAERWQNQLTKMLAAFAPFGRWLVRIKVPQVLGVILVIACLVGLVETILNSTIQFWLEVLGALLVICLLFAVVMAITRLVRRARGFEVPPRHSGHVITDTFDIVAYRIVSAKRGICPPVVFRNRSQ